VGPSKALTQTSEQALMMTAANRVQTPRAELRACGKVQIQQCFKCAQVMLNLFGASARRCSKV